jgi:SulP family sulfate permease
VAHALRVAPKSDLLVLVTCLGLTVFFDMVVAVTVGLPRDVLVYEVAGALFFGAAQKAMAALHRVVPGVSVVLLDLSAVPAIDATGLVSLEAALARLRAMHVLVVLAGVQEQPRRALAKAGVRDEPGRLAVCATAAEGVALARRHSRHATAAAGGAPDDAALPA